MTDETPGHVDPTKERFALFRDLPRDEPVHMLNLVRLKPRATYADGRAATGREAYAAYGRDSGRSSAASAAVSSGRAGRTSPSSGRRRRSGTSPSSPNIPPARPSST